MSTALLAFALLIGLGVVSFVIALGLAGLGLVLSWIFPLTPFQGALLHLVLLSLALIFVGVTFLIERIKDIFWTAPDEEEAILSGQADLPERNRGRLGFQESLPTHRDHPKVGRNDPCPCGSGKKYKVCCLLKL
jgi:hypothetical protein